MLNGDNVVKGDVNQFDDVVMNKNKKILYMNELDEERKQILDNLLKKNPKYQDVYDMIDRKNHFRRNVENIYIIEKRVFSERGKNNIEGDIKSIKEKRKKINKQLKFKNLYNEIESLNHGSFDFSRQNNLNFNNKSTNIYSIYMNNFENNKYNNNKKYIIQLKKDKTLFPKSKNFFKRNNYILLNNNKNKNLSENEIKKWIMNEKYHLNDKEHFYGNESTNNSNFVDFSKNSNNENNKYKAKKNIKPIIYYSNDFFETQLDNFENSLNKIGRNNLFSSDKNDKFKRKRLLSS